jgi:hypothetical protein
MTDCTEWQPAPADNGLADERQEGMSKVGPDMTDCTEWQPAPADNGLADEGQEGMSKVGSA